jgi:hypothetical protein
VSRATAFESAPELVYVCVCIYNICAFHRRERHATTGESVGRNDLSALVHTRTIPSTGLPMRTRTSTSATTLTPRRARACIVCVCVLRGSPPSRGATTTERSSLWEETLSIRLLCGVQPPALGKTHAGYRAPTHCATRWICTPRRGGGRWRARLEITRKSTSPHSSTQRAGVRDKYRRSSATPAPRGIQATCSPPEASTTSSFGAWKVAR